MENHFEMNDALFEKEFENLTFNTVCFTHEAHLRLAWIHIRKYGKKQAILNISNQLLNFVTFLGVSEKYNQTLTIASIEIISHFMKKSKSDNFKDFIYEFPRLNTHFRELLAYHYKTDIFSSPEAKTSYLKPDLCDF